MPESYWRPNKFYFKTCEPRELIFNVKQAVSVSMPIVFDEVSKVLKVDVFRKFDFDKL